MLKRDLLKENLTKRIESDIEACNVGAAEIIVKEKGETAFYGKFGDKLPEALVAELETLKANLK